MSDDKQIVKQDEGNIMEQVLILGDLSKLSQQQRATYYLKVCESVGLNPLTRPFDYITLNGKLTLYARKDATDQMREKRGVSVTDLQTLLVNEVYVVTAKGVDAGGRQDTSTGAVFIGGLKGPDLANAMMKAETKAKRRMTLSLCGLGFLDETETETIPGAQAVTVTEDGKIVDSAKAEHKPIGTKADQVNFNDVARSAMAKGWTKEQVEDTLAEVGDYAKATEKIISELP